jgi:hypothetical protein
MVSAGTPTRRAATARDTSRGPRRHLHRVEHAGWQQHNCTQPSRARCLSAADAPRAYSPTSGNLVDTFTPSLANVVATGFSPPTHHYSPIVTDTGCTGHFFTQNSHLLNIRPINQACPSIAVTLTDGAAIHSTHVGELNLPSTPFEARLVHIFPKLAADSLLSQSASYAIADVPPPSPMTKCTSTIKAKPSSEALAPTSPSSGTCLTFSHHQTRLHPSKVHSPMPQNSLPRPPSSLPSPTQLSADQSFPPFARPWKTTTSLVSLASPLSSLANTHHTPLPAQKATYTKAAKTNAALKAQTFQSASTLMSAHRSPQPVLGQTTATRLVCSRQARSIWIKLAASLLHLAPATITY